MSKLNAIAAGICLALAASAAAPAAAASPWLRPGTQLSFHGAVGRANKDGTPVEPEKTFDLTILVAAANPDGGAQVYWLLDESGRGGWSWIDQAGRWSLDRLGAAASGTGPALLYDRGEGTSTIGLESPLLLAAEPFAAGASWNEGNVKREVLAREAISTAADAPGKEQQAWKVAVANNYGYKRTQWVDDGGLVLQLSERVFMGRGEEYELTWRLAAVEQLADKALAERTAQFAALLDLVAGLRREPRTERADLTEAELASLKTGLPQAETTITAGPLVKLLAAAKSDLNVQTSRASDVAEMSARFAGKPAPEFKLDGLAGARLAAADLKGQVTVLHFWDYRDEPLREPYGQIGYLDFLFDKRKADGVKVFGVAVDARLGDEAKRGAAARSAAKLVSFMNLSYPLLLDAGEVLKQFGDPRLVGAQLPLFVVIDAEGKIVHYFVGCYEVDRDAGLKQLNEVLDAALKK
ncbi:MAG: TlpA family protein disulfide reductase [Planctomycetaceae bacterium]|nr:TlpA family protein disulfide reductase [Planctomycetaceae bacterium]